LPETAIVYLTFGSWLTVGIANYFGIRISAGAQLVLSALLVALLAIFVVLGFPSVQTQHFHPFVPNGFRGVGTAGLLIFWSFLGWEAIAHLAEEFKNPKRDMVRAAVAAGIIVAVFYLAVSFVLIGVGIFQPQSGQNAPLVTLAARMFGSAGRIFTGLLAAVICLGTMNAYMAGLSRLCYAMARDGDLPKFLATLDPKTGTPKSSVLFLLGLNCLSLSIEVFLNLPLRIFFLLQNVAFLVLYILGCISAARLLKHNSLAVAAAYFAAAICAVMLPFASGILLYPSVIVAIALIVLFYKHRRVKWLQNPEGL